MEIVSADMMVEERSCAPCFAATVLIDQSELSKLEGGKLLPGMSSETMIRTGARTVLSYPAEPITQNFRRAMREKLPQRPRFQEPQSRRLGGVIFLDGDHLDCRVTLRLVTQ
ncbi:hypothetical protein ABID08_001372 [Rhizobium binae]|uniref:AprE-like beta-barrel domain-containing protein n=1 Tax=Rhizobium binae TaxID=1138190 RepID=A0ABV2MC25_9HYPH